MSIPIPPEFLQADPADQLDYIQALQEAVDEATKEQWLERALREGEQSGVFEGDPFEAARRELGWPRGK